MTRQAGKETVHKLIKDFENNESQYMSKDFQETEVRNLFLNPFFTALDWELNQSSIAKKFWDVHIEDRQRDNFTTKKPDYAFRIKEGINYKKKFFVEAKAPHVDLNKNDPVYQAKRYAFSSHGKTPIVILTDFQTFRVFNGLEKPIFENPLQGLIKGLDLEYHAYLDKWDEIWDAFSKEAVINGSIEQLVGKVSRNVKSLDDEFLTDISSWRETLAKNIARKNESLSEEHINEAVQRILDRLIFIRNLEDRDIENFGKTEGLLAYTKEKEPIYPKLISIFHKLDNDYNGLLFKKHFSGTIDIDDTAIKTIIKQLYPPQSPYAFDIIEPEILGRIYERFLGSKIRLTLNHQAKVEEKPEVKKAGGVYYTPQYIVDYIVGNTVGVKTKDKTPEEIAEIKICDPACGSGSFLLGAFQYLIEYHREWYANANQTTQKKYKNDFFTTAENEIQLTLKKKTEILKNNIFGVDIDREATEVAIMSLYLKILDEGYDKGQIELFMRGHILPDMTNNIKCGNSLIGTDFYNHGNLELDDNNLNKLNCFDWDGKDGFAEIFKNGGFDVIIGNPPYVFTRDVDWSDDVKKYYWNKFGITKNADNSRKNQSGKINLFILFLLKSTELLKKDGLYSFIIPNGLLRTTTYDTTRKFILEHTTIERIVDLKEGVFDGVTASTIILILINNTIYKDTLVIDANYKRDNYIDETKTTRILQRNFLNNISYAFSIFVNTEEQSLFNKLNISNYYLKDIIIDIIEGIVAHKELISQTKINKMYKPMLEGKDIKKYKINFGGHYILFDKKKIHRPRPDYIWEAKTKIVIQRISGGNSPLVATIDKDNYLSFASTNLLLIKDNMLSDYSYNLVCALLNSKLWNFYYCKSFSNSSNLTVNISKTYLEMLPLPKIIDKTKHDDIVSLVDKILDLKQKEAAELSDHLKTVITRQIDAVDKAIDTAVYELYNLTAEEIKIVES